MGYNLKNRTAVVTGASRGLGAAMARVLGASGARVVLDYCQSETEAKELARYIRRNSGEAVAIRADLRDPAQIQALVAEAEQAFGPVEILVNNATGPQPMLPLEQYTWQDYQDQLDFFVKAPLLLAQAVLPKMKAARWGRIIHIGSEVADIGNANYSAYVTAKAAMVGMTRSWASELGATGITVNLVAPGWIPVERHANTDPALLKAYSAGVPLLHQGTPDDVAHAVAFLASDEAGFITGQCLSVNGGNTF